MDKKTIKKTEEELYKNVDAHPRQKPIPFKEFLDYLRKNPQAIIRNVFQVFHDMIKHYVGEGFEEYPDDPENIGFVFYDCYPLFVEGTDRPFFADRLFAYRLMNLTKALRQGAQYVSQ